MIRNKMIATRTELVAERGICVGGHMAEAEAGARILEQGGNAVDAVVAAAFTGYVVEPASCGVGGQGHMAVYLADRQELITIDLYIRAPGRARPDMYEVDPARTNTYDAWPAVVGRRNETGHLAVGVPGAVAGLCLAHERYGKLPLAQVLEPAIEAAEAGVPITWSLALVIAGRLEEIRQLPHAAALLLRNGNVPRVGVDRIDFSELAGTLRRIARHGAAGFYAGPVAEAIERELAANGGILTAADLAEYRPKLLREKPASYRGYSYVTANDQVGYEALNILDHFDLGGRGPDSVEYRHLMAEALGHAFTDHLVHYGDPDHTRSPANGLASRAFAAERAAGIRLDRAAPRPIVAGNPWPYESAADAPVVIQALPSAAGLGGTSQMAAADHAGNLVTLITSLSTGFGSLVLVPGTGVFMNNSMLNFDPRPDRANCIAPGKMPIYAAPSLIATKDGRAVFGGCGSGGYRIEGGVLHTLVNAVDFGMRIQAAVDWPRVHCQGNQTYVDSRIPAAVQARLAELGHAVVPVEETVGQTNFGRVCAIRIDPATGLLHAGSGPAWSTGAAGF
ncbi:MAG: gamma-glutamyltransferase [Chloroflexi bacterium]|nr:gamma-glutamyltransferase [Chloroflexota bacterium]